MQSVNSEMVSMTLRRACPLFNDTPSVLKGQLSVLLVHSPFDPGLNSQVFWSGPRRWHFDKGKSRQEYMVVKLKKNAQ